jgi:hypothetical protein
MLLLCGCISELGAAEAEAHVQATVDMFLRAYQATPAAQALRRAGYFSLGYFWH